MHKLIAMYKKPDDVDAFMHHYQNVHMPLVEKVPGLASVTVNHCTANPMGGDPEYFMIVEMNYPDAETFKAAMKSPENMATGKDVMTFAKGLVTLVVAHEQENY